MQTTQSGSLNPANFGDAGASKRDAEEMMDSPDEQLNRQSSIDEEDAQKTSAEVGWPGGKAAPSKQDSAAATKKPKRSWGQRFKGACHFVRKRYDEARDKRKNASEAGAAPNSGFRRGAAEEEKTDTAPAKRAVFDTRLNPTSDFAPAPRPVSDPRLNPTSEALTKRPSLRLSKSHPSRELFVRGRSSTPKTKYLTLAPSKDYFVRSPSPRRRRTPQGLRPKLSSSVMSNGASSWLDKVAANRTVKPGMKDRPSLDLRSSGQSSNRRQSVSRSRRSHSDASTSSRSNSDPRREVITIENSRYLVSKHKLGEGTFGYVKAATNVNTGEEVVIKFFKTADKDAVKEIEAYIAVSEGCRYVPAYRGAGRHKGEPVLVTQRIGAHLGDLTKRIPRRKLSKQSLAMLAIELIDALEAFHKSGYLHRDLHEGNVTCGLKDESKMYLIDLGFAIPYRNEDGSHVRRNINQRAVGTSRFSSINNHKHLQQSRRDDMESLAYLLIQTLVGNLPWKVHAKNPDRRKKWSLIMMCKRQFEESQFFEQLPAEIQQYVFAVKRLGFEERPAYGTYRKWFRDLLHREERINGRRHFDWINRRKAQSKRR